MTFNRQAVEQPTKPQPPGWRVLACQNRRLALEDARKRRKFVRELDRCQVAAHGAELSRWAGFADASAAAAGDSFCFTGEEHEPAAILSILGWSSQNRAAHLIRFILERVPYYTALGSYRARWAAFRRTCHEDRGGTYQRLYHILQRGPTGPGSW